METLIFLLLVIALIITMFDEKVRKQFIRQPLPIKNKVKAGDKNGEKTEREN